MRTPGPMIGRSHMAQRIPQREQPSEPGWWQASDGWWYPPESAPGWQRAAPPPPIAREMPWVLHVVVVYLLVFLVMYAAVFIIGIFWFAFMLKRTGRRARDMVLIPVPVVGPILVLWPTLWRATSRNTYWSPRPDFFSEPTAAWTPPLRWFKEIGRP